MPEQYAQIANAQFGNRIVPFPLPTQPLDVHLYWRANVARPGESVAAGTMHRAVWGGGGRLKL